MTEKGGKKKENISTNKKDNFLFVFCLYLTVIWYCDDSFMAKSILELPWVLTLSKLSSCYFVFVFLTFLLWCFAYFGRASIEILFTFTVLVCLYCFKLILIVFWVIMLYSILGLQIIALHFFCRVSLKSRLWHCLAFGGSFE